MRVSLIITTYNWPAALDLTLGTVALQTRMPDEVVVADDGSGPETEAVVRRWIGRLPCPLHHVWQEDSGFRLARSRNRAIARANGDYIVLIDGDMLLHPAFIADHVGCSRRDSFIQGARPQLSAEVTQNLLRSGVPNVSVFSPGMQRRAYAWRSVILSRFASKAKFALGGIQGCNQSFWRDHFVRVNGYDERFTGWGPEDREFAARLLHIGIKRNYVRHRAIAYHLHHKSRAPGGSNPFDDLLEETLRTRAVRCEHGLTAPTANRGTDQASARPASTRAGDV
jgi:glycosyltransferase involved in cell wall biosynthesis